MKHIIITALISIILASCSHTHDYSAVRVTPLYRQISPDSLVDDTIALRAYLAVMVTDSMANPRAAVAESPAVRAFAPPVEVIYSDDNIEYTIGKILGRAYDAGVVLPPRHYAAVVWGRPESILFVDSTMLIALNHYLGADFEGYSHLPAYQRSTKTPQALPYDIAESLLGTQYPYNGKSVLSRLLYEGAMAYAKNNIVGVNDPATALGYSKDEYQWLQNHEKQLWSSITAQGMLFSNDSRTAQSLVSQRPSTPELIHGTPGRAGRYIGYKMIEEYMNRHKDQQITNILEDGFYSNPDILSVIQYNP